MSALTGCRSGKRHLGDARHAFVVGDFENAQLELTEFLEKGPAKSRPAGELDLAIVELASGRPQDAENRLRQLRDHFDAQIERTPIDEATALALDDNARDYQIAPHEHVLLRSLLAVCSLLGDQTDAEAYCLQAQQWMQRQQRLANDTAQPDSTAISDISVPDPECAVDPSVPATGANPNVIGQVAFAPYLHGAIREATHQNYDDAERAFRLVSNIRPTFRPSHSDITRAKEGLHSRPGHGVVYVIAMVGQGPRLVETVAETTTASLQVASTFIRRIGQDQEDEGEPVLPNIATVKVPAVEIPISEIAAVGVSVEQNALGATQTITDVGELTRQHVDSEMTATIARAVARRVIKETSVAATAEALGLQDEAAAAFKFAAMNAWSASEKADTRCWSLLPRELQVLRAELPVGSHSMTFSALSHSGNTYHQMDQKVVVEDGRNQYLLIVAPERIEAVLP